MIEISFHGATGTVTGSKYMLRVNDQRVLVDCGMFQGPKALRVRNWQPLPFDPGEIDAVVITHAHIDHIGYLPRLVAMGYNGPVLATEPTVDVAGILLKDAAHIQEEDADYRNRKGLTTHEKALPLFTSEDAKAAKKLFKPVYFREWNDLGPGVRFRHHRAGHIIGAGFVEFELNDGKDQRRVIFSGDLGRYGSPIIPDPVAPPQPDVLVVESTYGGRLHPPQDPLYMLETVIKDIIERKSVLLIPAFAVGRTQQVIYLINELIANGRIPPIEINIDSPMAVRATDIYVRHNSYHRIEVQKLGGKKCVLNGEYVKLHRKRKSSKLLNKLKGPAIIISASGMMSGGRIMHHLINRLPDPEVTLMTVGYSAEGTLGRKLMDGEKMVYIHKQPIEVKAKIINVQGLSAHADYHEILHWLEPMKRQPDRVFITHGEPAQSQALAEHLKGEYGWETTLPELDQTVRL